jgi:hypothetical protein
MVAAMTRRTAEGQRPDVIALVDLAPRERVTGGSERRVFGANPLTPALNQRAMKPANTDLPARKNPHGGKLAVNDSLTLVRSA